MCGRYVLISKISEVEKRFNVKSAIEWVPNFNIGPGSMAPIISSDRPKELILAQFGLTPFWAKKKMYLFNARAEGDHNKENDPQYHGAMGIIKKPAFRKSIRSNRCLIPADCFIEGTTKDRLDKPFLVHLGKGNRPFAFAGIWDDWVDQESGEITRSYSIITTVPNKLLLELPHHRSPVILEQNMESKWLDVDLPLGEVTSMLGAYSNEDMNAYPISAEIKNPRNNRRELLNPLGPPVLGSAELKLEQELVLEGMGFTRGRERRNLE